MDRDTPPRSPRDLTSELKRLEATGVDAGRVIAELRREVARLRRTNSLQKMEIDGLRAREHQLEQRLRRLVGEVESLAEPEDPPPDLLPLCGGRKDAGEPPCT